MAKETTGGKGLINALLYGQGAVPFAAAWIGSLFVIYVLLVFGHAVLPAFVPAISLSMITGEKAGTGTTTPIITSSGGGCPSTGGSNIQAKAEFYNTSTKQDSLAATTFVAYLKGSPTLLITSATGTTGFNNTGTINCKDDVTGFFGDGGAHFYYQQVDFKAMDALDTYVVGKPKASSAMTATFSNSTTLGASAVGVSIGSGATNSDATILLKAGSDYYGDSKVELCAVYEKGNITDVNFGVGVKQLTTVDQSISVASGYGIKCYEWAGDMYNYKQVSLPVVIQAVPGVDPSATNVSLYLNDYSGYLKNGGLITGYVNGDTNADLGLAVVSYANAIQVG